MEKFKHKNFTSNLKKKHDKIQKETLKKIFKCKTLIS